MVIGAGREGASGLSWCLQRRHVPAMECATQPCGCLAPSQKSPRDRGLEENEMTKVLWCLPATSLLAKATGVPIIDACGRTTLQELAGTIASAKLIITNETGAAHIAAALGRPAVTILGGGHFNRFLPYPIENHCVRSAYQRMDCYGCNWRCIYKPADPGPCILKVTVDDVWTLVGGVLDDDRHSWAPQRVEIAGIPR
jgi:hypothetical protein